MEMSRGPNVESTWMVWNSKTKSMWRWKPNTNSITMSSLNRKMWMEHEIQMLKGLLGMLAIQSWHSEFQITMLFQSVAKVKGLLDTRKS